MCMMKESYRFTLSLCSYISSLFVALSLSHARSHTHLDRKKKTPGKGSAEYSVLRPPLANLERNRGAKIGAPCHDIDRELLLA